MRGRTHVDLRLDFSKLVLKLEAPEEKDGRRSITSLWAGEQDNEEMTRTRS